MRRPARVKSRQGQVSRSYSVAAPVRGWNARDGVADMKPGYAVQLTNWFPSSSDVQLRKGSANHVTSVDGGAVEVETLISYRPVSGSHELWGFAGTKLFDVSTAGAAPSATVSSLTNARWQCINFSTAAGNFVLAVNGADDMLHYNGTTWAEITGVSTPSITNVSSADLVHLNAFKERVWYVEKDSMSVWYTGVGAFAGALTEFSLGSVFKRGGYLMAMGTWTVDGGQGIDDLAVFITSEGEVAVYQGTNPAAAETWALIGIFNIGAPLGRRCFLKYAGDLLIITQDGLVPCSKALAADRTSSAVAVSDAISGALGDAASAYGNTFGWEAALYPDGGALIVNVPVAVGAQQQYVMNTNTGAWCNFTGWAANCFEIHNDELYFGTLGAVRKAWTGTSDVGANIVGEAVGAFDYFGSRNTQKVMRMIRPIIGWDSNPSEFLVGTDVDFVVNTPTGVISFATGSEALWDTGIWDSAIWTGDVVLNKLWYTVTGVGYAVAPHIRVSSNSAVVKWASTSYIYENGSFL